MTFVPLILEIAGVLLAMGILFVFLWVLPKRQASKLMQATDKERFEAENAARDTLSKVVTGVLLLLTILISFESARIAQQSSLIAQRSAQITQDGQFADRFTKAMDLLAKVNAASSRALESRVGGAYALERIANDSESDYWPVVEALTTYVRMNSPAAESPDESPKPANIDIRTVMTIIGRRKHNYLDGEGRQIELTFANLTSVNLEGAHLQWARLDGSKLTLARLKNAHLEHGSFRDARFSQAILDGAHLEGADLATARGLTTEQLRMACVDGTTSLPPDVHAPSQPCR